MALSWKAKTCNGTYDSTLHDYSMIPKDELEEFTLLAPLTVETQQGRKVQEFGMTVNLITGRLSIEGDVANMPEIMEAILDEPAPVKHYYFQRGYTDFNSSDLQASGAGISYAVCGWEGQKKRVFLRFDGENNKIEVHVKDV
jgi:hypothetical protein